LRSGAVLLGVGLVSFLCGVGHWRFLYGQQHPPHVGREARAARHALSRPTDPGAVETDVLPLSGEFEKQSALMLACDEMAVVFPRLLVDIVRAAQESIPIVGVVRQMHHVPKVSEVLTAGGVRPETVQFVVIPSDAQWIRDYGPIFLRRKDGSVFIADCRYRRTLPNKALRLRDDAAPAQLGRSIRMPVVSVPLDLEGGNLLSNGAGLYVTSTGTIARNYPSDPERGRALLERLLPKHFGGDRWVFVRPLEGESTGHVDMFMTFVAPDVAVVARCDPGDDPLNAAILDETAAKLTGLPTPRGPMKVHRVPMPKVRNGWRTYTNVIFANGTLLMPTFQDVPPEIQNEALCLYARLLPGWRIVGIRTDELVRGQGLLHCVCLHLPSFLDAEDLSPALPQSPPTAAAGPWRSTPESAAAAIR